ncbi:hypothetical protein ZIOFF_069544 [Zingiber officinale]|uniref:Uncharacterized protein n=1 Tax=Zingiber officinale TaxID=94328 RepID=A0A8J5CDT1_ZINOF|nr:hypothetical protein ZIOFF_069544 [Zingiber officinale]
MQSTDCIMYMQSVEVVLRGLCQDLDIPFQTSMLKWEAGPKSIDGIWAPWWYENVHKSTGFEKPNLHMIPFPLELYDLLEQSLPFYNMLRCHCRRLVSSLHSSLPFPPLPVPANEKILIWVGDELLPRENAKVSVFDSVVQGGDAVWEGLRVYNGKVFKLDEHLDRMFDSAKALAFIDVPTREEIKGAVFKTLVTNGMFDNAHIRLTLTRGKKVTSGMSPAFNLYGCTLIVLAEWKPPVYDNTGGIRLVTATTRRNSPNSIDSKIHHNNLINNILAKIEGNLANAEDAIMLDKDGFVSETNATNIFMVKKGHVLTPHADYCLPGITRATVMDLVLKENLILHERRISLSEFHAADEVLSRLAFADICSNANIFSKKPTVVRQGLPRGNGLDNWNYGRTYTEQPSIGILLVRWRYASLFCPMDLSCKHFQLASCVFCEQKCCDKIKFISLPFFPLLNVHTLLPPFTRHSSTAVGMHDIVLSSLGTKTSLGLT